MTALYATAAVLICTAAAAIVGAAIHTIRNRRHLLLTWRRRLAWCKPWPVASVGRNPR